MPRRTVWQKQISAALECIWLSEQMILSQFSSRKGAADISREGIRMSLSGNCRPTGSKIKGRNPNVPVGELQANWVKDTCVVYIGKAGGGSSRATLRKRIGQYIRFGSGEPVGHWGGRYIWQLEDADNLLFCWRAAIEWEDAEEIESELIENFKSRYDGHRPFANLKD